jgi:hypothetical protein
MNRITAWIFLLTIMDLFCVVGLQAAFDYVVKNDLKMKVTCTYLQKYLEEHASPEYTCRIVE